MKSVFFLTVIIATILIGATFHYESKPANETFRIVKNEEGDVLSVFATGSAEPVLTHNAPDDYRPYLHPVKTPDGRGILTEYSPGHHLHQTGIYWGYTRLNGRDYFHNRGKDYWKKVSSSIITAVGSSVKWQTTYDLLDEKGGTVLTETQTWEMGQKDGRFQLSLEWQGEAKTDVTIGRYDYGGLFVRMPWKPGIEGEVVNAARQKNEKAEGRPAMWIDVGMAIKGMEEIGHITILDHPGNKGYPQTWRVDNQLGIGAARSKNADWHIKKGETEIIRHQLLFHTGKLNDLEINKAFSEYTGSDQTYGTAALWAIAQKEGRDAKFLTAAEAVAEMTVKEGFQVNAFASEPMITQPMAFCWDDRGRLWVAENRDYEARGKGFSNSGDSRILILEDTDGDGVADSRKVFMEGIAFPAALAVGFDGVFIGAPPNLLYVPDRNRDDKADLEDIEVRLTGWGIRDRHETLNSFHWGPDGWLYGLQGFATPSKIRKPEGKGKLYKHLDPFPEDILDAKGVDINGGVWRYHPLKDKFEVVAHGFSNPWGIDYDSKGRFLMTACVIPHLWHVIPGGIYHRQGGQHFNPFVYSDIRTIADHSHRSAHGGARVYLSDAFPEEQRGRIFMANIHEHGVLSDILEPAGSGLTGRHGEEFLMANNAQWVGFSLEIGPEGAIYVLDWHDADICGSEVLNSETGRIFRITPQKSLAQNWAGRYADLSQMTDLQLAELQTSPSEWHARRARIILQSRASKGNIAARAKQTLEKIYSAHSNPDWRLRAFWTLHVTGALTQQDLFKALNDRDEFVRTWAVQFSCEDERPSPALLSKLSAMASTDDSQPVRLQIASALQRIPLTARWPIAQNLLTHPEDSEDHNLPKMIWYAVEPLVTESPEQALVLAAGSRIPMVTRYIARRAVDADKTEELADALSKMPPNLKSLLEGMRDGLEGRTDLRSPSNWKTLYGKLRDAEEPVARLALDIAAFFGDTEAAQKHLSVLKSPKAPLDQRRKALLSLSAQQRSELLPELPGLLNDHDLRKEAIRAAAAFDNKNLAQVLLDRYPGFNNEEKAEAIQALASRPASGWLLSQAIAKENIPRKDVPAYVARQLRRVVGSGFVEIWGPIDHIPSDERAYTKYRELLHEKKLALSDPLNGRIVYQNTCAPCHKMYGEGGTLGPDLTGSNRFNTDYLLSNILDPSGEIQDDYKMVVITTRDGRTYAGNIAAETDRQVTMRVVGQDAALINKSEIQSREETDVSMMPPGLFEALTEKEILDLVAYLQTQEQPGK